MPFTSFPGFAGFNLASRALHEFQPVEVVPVEEAAGRTAAEQITPYPPGVPAILPGERINAAVLEYLVSGKEAGIVLSDPADSSFKTIRSTRNNPEKAANPVRM